MALNQFLADVMLKVSKTGSFVDLAQARRDNINVEILEKSSNHTLQIREWQN